MKIKLLTLLTILTISLATSAPTTSARALIEGGGGPAPVTAPTTTTTTPTNTAPKPTAITTTNNASTTVPASSRVRDWVNSLSPAISNTINTVVSRVRDWVSSLSPVIGNTLNTLNIFNTPTNPPTTNQTDSSTIIKNLGSADDKEKAADKSGMATFTVGWFADNVSSWSVSGSDGFSSSGGSTTTGPLTKPPGIYTYTITGFDSSRNPVVSKSATITISASNVTTTTTNTITIPANTTNTTTNTINTGANNGTGGTGVTSGINQLTACNANISANPSSILPNKTSTLAWDCSSQAVGSCAISDNNPNVRDIGQVASSGSKDTPNIPSTTTFKLQCPGTIPSSVTVSVFNSYIKEVSPQ